MYLILSMAIGPLTCWLSGGVLFAGECGRISNLHRLAHLTIESLSDWVLIFGGTGLLLHIQQPKNRRGSNVDMKCGSFRDIFNVNFCWTSQKFEMLAVWTGWIQPFGFGMCVCSVFIFCWFSWLTWIEWCLKHPKTRSFLMRWSNEMSTIST